MINPADPIDFQFDLSNPSGIDLADPTLTYAEPSCSLEPDKNHTPNGLYSLTAENVDTASPTDSAVTSFPSTGFDPFACSDVGSVRASTISSDDEFDTPSTQFPYQLRQNIDRHKAFAHHDADQSGNYDPDEEEAKEKAAHLSRINAARKARKTRMQRNKQRKQQTTTIALEFPEQSADDFPPFSKPRRRNLARLPEASYTARAHLAAFDEPDTTLPTSSRSSLSPPPPHLEDASGNRGPLVKITTSFAHPLSFADIRLVPDPPSTHDTRCAFCAIPAFGITGYFAKTIDVIAWDSGLGFTEIGGGHCERHVPTHMCLECTLARVHILSCEFHAMERVRADPDTVAFDVCLDALLNATQNAEGARAQLVDWCTMCFSLATHACCTRGVSLRPGSQGAEVVEGCGLRLCSACEGELRETYEGCSSAMAGAMDREPKLGRREKKFSYEQSVRADVGLLCEDGLLMRVLLDRIGEEERGEEG